MALMLISKYALQFAEGSRPNKATVIRWINQGKIYGKKIGGQYYVDPDIEISSNPLVNKVLFKVALCPPGDGTDKIGICPTTCISPRAKTDAATTITSIPRQEKTLASAATRKKLLLLLISSIKFWRVGVIWLLRLPVMARGCRNFSPATRRKICLSGGREGHRYQSTHWPSIYASRGRLRGRLATRCSWRSPMPSSPIICMSNRRQRQKTYTEPGSTKTTSKRRPRETTPTNSRRR